MQALGELCRGWTQHIVDRWRGAVSPGSLPSASDDLDLLPWDISLDSLRSAVPIATFMCLVLKHLAQYFSFSFSLLKFAYVINIALPHSGAGEESQQPRRTPNSSSWRLNKSISKVQTQSTCAPHRASRASLVYATVR